MPETSFAFIWTPYKLLSPSMLKADPPSILRIVSGISAFKLRIIPLGLAATESLIKKTFFPDALLFPLLPMLPF